MVAEIEDWTKDLGGLMCGVSGIIFIIIFFRILNIFGKILVRVSFEFFGWANGKQNLDKKNYGKNVRECLGN